MVKVLRSFVLGPLEPYVVGFTEALCQQGYRRSSASQHICFIAHLDRWMSAAGVEVGQLGGPMIERYLAERRAAGYREYRSPRAFAPLLAYLGPLGVLPAPAVLRRGPVEELLDRYRDYLIVERGLTPATVRGYVDAVRPFVASRLHGEAVDMAGIGAADVSAFVLVACPGRAVGPAKLIVCALRSLLRWLHLTGAVAVPLATAVPSVAGWRLSGLPRGLEPAQLRTLLAACDRRTAAGRRDYAVLLLLSRLGLRAGEVAVLGLDDIDWRSGEIVVRGKGNRAERRPASDSRRPQRVHAGAGAAPGVELDRGDEHRLRDGAARRAGHGARPPAAAYRRHRTVAGGRHASRGRAGAAASLPADHGDLREGRPGRADSAGPAVAHAHRRWCVVTGPLRNELADYLALRRALGYRLARPAKLLVQFLDYLDQAGQSTITVAAALDWARRPASGNSNWWSYRLSAVRGFATYLHGLDPRHDVPPSGLLPHRPLRASPYLYSDADIAALITATGSLRTPLRRATFATLIGLLAVTGMRIGEAIALDRGDLDTAGATLTIRHGKFDKARIVVLHDSSITALTRYLRQRDRLTPASRSPALLASDAGTRLIYCNVHVTWKRLVAHAGLRPRSAACRPRIHDLRHSFAVRAMLDAYTAGQDGQQRLTLLSTWLGHVHPGSTYWYLSASPELMAVAGHRLEAHLAGRRP